MSAETSDDPTFQILMIALADLSLGFRQPVRATYRTLLIDDPEKPFVE